MASVMHTGRLFRGERQGILFVAPAVALFFIVLAFPIGFAIALSFFNIESKDLEFVFVGVDNIAHALKDTTFWNALSNTLIYTFASVILQFFVGFALALCLNSKWLKARSFLRLCFMAPWTLSYVVISVTWQWILNAQFGVLNAFLRGVGIISENISWLGSADLALPTVILVNVWRGYPFIMVMLYAGLQLIPKEQIEAAEVDGASSLQLFWHITLPNLKNVITISTVLTFIRIFIQFDLVQILTAGGPGRATELLSNLIYKVSFSFFKFGYGSAVSLLMLLIVLVCSIVYVKLLQSRD